MSKLQNTLSSQRHWLATIALLSAGVWPGAGETWLLVGLMLLLPMLDRGWNLPRWTTGGPRFWGWMVVVILVIAALLAWQPNQIGFASMTLLTAALPEEWFFRAYLMPHLGRGLAANLMTSCLFSLLHGLTRGPIIALQVFAPSLFFGWCYQRSANLPLVVLIHALSNLVFVLFLAPWFQW